MGINENRSIYRLKAGFGSLLFRNRVDIVAGLAEKERHYYTRPF